MVNVLDVFGVMDREMARRGYALENDQYVPEAFDYRSRLYRRDAKSAMSLLWDARDYWFILQGGSPWRDLAIYRDARHTRDGPEAIVAALLRDVADERPGRSLTK